VVNEEAALDAGEAAARCATMDSSARAIRSSVACFGGEDGRFVAGFADFRWGAREAAREPVLLGFFDILGVPDDAPISGLAQGCKRPK